MTVTVDAILQEDAAVTLIDDWAEHDVEVVVFTDVAHAPI